jgi:hypothetical protein
MQKLMKIGASLAERVERDCEAGKIPAHDALTAVTGWAHLTLRSLGVKKPTPDKE